MKVTGLQYLELNPDLKAANVDPLQHFLNHVCPVGPLREQRIIDIAEPSSLPPDWNWEVYLAGWKDLRLASLDTKEEAEQHYLGNGFYEHRWPIPPLPAHWEDDAYFFLYPEVAANSYYSKFPWAHYFDTKETEPRVYMPEGWNPVQYMANYPDVTSLPLTHYWKYGKAEGRIYDKSVPPVIPPVEPPIEPPVEPPVDPGVYVAPPDWENEAYLFHFPDVAASAKYGNNPLAHWFESGLAEKRVWKPEGWSSAQYLKNYPEVVGVIGPLLHWWRFGKAEGRTYEKPWEVPTTPGPYVIYSKQDQREIFSVHSIPATESKPAHLVIGDYGLNVGGVTIREWYKNRIVEIGRFSKNESNFDLYLPEDGQMLATFEHYGNIRKQLPSGWDQKYGKSSNTALMFYIRKAGNNLYGNWMYYDKAQGGVVRADVNGNSWVDLFGYTGKVLLGMTSNGSEINLAGKTGAYQGAGYPILTDINGSIMSGRSDLQGYLYWGVAKHKGVYIMGTCAGYNIATATGQIHTFNGSQNKTVWSDHRNVIHRIESYKDRVYAVVTNDWESSKEKTSLLLSSANGAEGSWRVDWEIPCPSILGVKVADGGMYISGGRYQDFGWIGFFKFSE